MITYTFINIIRQSANKKVQLQTPKEITLLLKKTDKIELKTNRNVTQKKRDGKLTSGFPPPLIKEYK